MARKSRKNLLQPEQATVSVQFPELDEEKIPTAIYGRLSVEDDEDNESMETQIALVQDFINRSSELNYVDTYFDNGFTGTNFKRPAFTRLMNDVRQKKIKCIVVKDLSRFGRNYLEARYYIETVFPFLGVRLIAVTDHFDSTRKEDMHRTSGCCSTQRLGRLRFSLVQKKIRMRLSSVMRKASRLMQSALRCRLSR